MLLGRDRELRTISRLLEGAREGRSGVLALVGEAGIGKSSLLDAAVGLSAGMHVLRARGVQSERQIPFAGLFELLRPALACLDRIPPPQAEALESALALRPARPEDRFATGAATLSLLAAHAENEPLALLVDDAQWLDGSSADALLFAARRLVADPIAVLLTVRAGEPSLLDGADLPALTVAGLDEEAAAALVRREAPGTDESLALRLHRETGGNPLALLELAREPLQPPPLDAPVPARTSVAEAYLHRVHALPAASREALVLAAATDRSEPALLARAGEALGVGVADLAPAEAAGLVREVAGRLEFRHPLARSAIYGNAPAELRRRVHLALAGALPDADADRRAWHLALAAAGPDEIASSALEQAGLRAQERSAYDAAAHAFERAAQLAADDAGRGRLLVGASDAAYAGGATERVAALLDEAERFGADPVELAHRRGQLALRRGPLGEARRVLLAGVDDAEPARAAVLLADAVYGAFYTADAEWMHECAERARALGTRDVDARTAFYTAIAEGIAGVFFGKGDAGAVAIRAAVALHERADELQDDLRALGWAAIAPLWLRESGIGHDVVDRALAATRSRAAVGTLPHLLAHVGFERASTDHWVEAQAAFDEAIALARETGQRVVLAAALARLALLEARRGRERACRADAAEALELARELGAAQCEVWALAALAELELVRGDVDTALVRFEEVAALLRSRSIGDVDVSPAPEQVELYLRLGRTDDAAAALAPFAAAADAKGQPWARARAARSRALLAGDDELAARFEEALELHRATPDVFETARTQLAYGARLRRSGRRVAARDQLRAAFEALDSLGAVPWAEQARVELGATGERARRRDPSSLDELTPQELQVSLLLAEGRTTREAAAALFLSPKTIEYHLRNAYRKLDVHSRDELRAALRPADPTPV